MTLKWTNLTLAVVFGFGVFGVISRRIADHPGDLPLLSKSLSSSREKISSLSEESDKVDTRHTDVVPAKDTPSENGLIPSPPITLRIESERASAPDDPFATLLSGASTSIDVDVLSPLMRARVGETVRIPLKPPLEGIVNMKEVHKTGEVALGIRLTGYPEASAFLSFKKDGGIEGHLFSKRSASAYRLETGDRSTSIKMRRIAVPDLLCARVKNNVVLPGMMPAPDDPREPEVSTDALPEENTSELSSAPGATKVIYLDFDGETVSGTPWNANFNDGEPIVAAPFLNPERIAGIWESISEDYIVFNVNVTTDRTAYNNAAPGDRVMVIFTPSKEWYGTSGGVAYVNSFGNATHPCCWVFNRTLNGAAESGSHEAGHTLGLRHDGTSIKDYYSGHTHSSGVSWAPIMGTGYSRDIVQFSKGEYPSANRLEDDFELIRNDLPYRPDDHGDVPGGGTVIPEGARGVISDSGIVGNENDVDVFRFETDLSGTIAVEAKALAEFGNLDLKLELLNASFSVLAMDAPAGPYNAEILSTSQPAGIYYLRISGSGLGDLTTGYSNYGSVGSYTLTGSYPSTLLPETPSGLSASDGAFPDEVHLAWNPAARADAYKIYRATADHAANAGLLGTSLTNTYTDISATPGTPYYYFVSAFNTEGESSKSGSDAGFVRLPIPSPPGGITASVDSPHYIRVSWDAVPYADSYRIFRNSVDSPTGATELSVTTSLFYQDTGTLPEEVVYYFIAAINVDGTSDPGGGSNNSGVKLPLPPGTPTHLAASYGTSSSHTALTWTGATQASGYYVYRNTNNTTVAAELIGTTGLVTTFLDTGVIAGIPYYYFVRSNLPDGPSDPSNIEVGFREAVAPPAPLQVTATHGIYPGKVQVTWNAVPNTLTYSLFRSDTDAPGTAELLTETTGLDWEDDSVSPGRSYFYYVRAGNNGGDSPFSESAIGFGSEADPLDDVYENNDTLSLAFLLPPFHTIAARAVAGDPDWYEVRVEAGDVRLDLAAYCKSPGDIISLRLFDASGNLVATAGEALNSRVLSFPANSDTSYFIQIEGDTSALVAYDLFWRSLDANEHGILVDETIGFGSAQSLGDGIINSTAAGQTLFLRTRKARANPVYVTAINRSAVSATLITRGNRGNRKFRVAYLQTQEGVSRNVSAALIRSGTPTPLKPFASAHFRITVTHSIPKRKRAGISLRILSHPQNDPSTADVVRCRVKKPRIGRRKIPRT